MNKLKLNKETIMSKYLQQVNEVLSKPSRSVAIVNENINENFLINEVVEENQKDEKQVMNESVFQKIYNESKREKWIPKMKKGALHKQLGISQKEKIPTEVLKKKKTILSKKAEGEKKLSPKEAKLSKRVNLALTLRKFK